tara:strand:+ start:1867 stop:2106 length:240 start_codon:yes stop_codon:yes gene_type:complete
MSIEEQIDQWKAALADQKQKKQNEIQIITEHQKELENIDQQILLITGGLTFAEKIPIPAVEQPASIVEEEVTEAEVQES